jgi:hypothetical protein
MASAIDDTKGIMIENDHIRRMRIPPPNAVGVVGAQ